MNLTIGGSPDSWGVWFPENERQTPWSRFLDEVAAAGYEWIELGPYGYLPTDLPTLRSELAWRGLKVSAGCVCDNLWKPDAWPSLERQVLGCGEILQALGAKFLVVIDEPYNDLFTGKPIGPERLDEAAWKRLVESIHKVAELARDRFDLHVLVHPHADTHIEYEDQIERVLAETDPKRVFLCLDLGQHAYRGGDPVAFLRKHYMRIPYLHFKSVDREIQKSTADRQLPFATVVSMGMFCGPFEQGIVDFVGFKSLLEELNFSGWAIVEQDMYPAPFDKPLPIARRALAYLKKMGLA